MCEFFSGVVRSNCEVLTLGNTSNHREMIEHFKLDDSLDVKDVKRDWVKFELTPSLRMGGFFSLKD